MAKSEEKIRIRAEYSVTGKTINYTVIGILSLGGYGVYHSGSDSEESGGFNKHSFIKLQSEVREIQLEMKVFSTRLPKIEKDEKSLTL